MVDVHKFDSWVASFLRTPSGSVHDCPASALPMHTLPAGCGSTLPRGCTQAPLRRWAARSCRPAHHLVCRHQLAQQRQFLGAEQQQQQPAWWCTGQCRTGWCRTVCSNSAEQHASGRAASGVRGLLHRLRSSLPSADALALQAGAVRHPKFAPMVLLYALLPAKAMALSHVVVTALCIISN